MFEKVKLWMMTDENKEKYLLEKEKEEREKKRRGEDIPEKKKGKKDKPLSKKQIKENKKLAEKEIQDDVDLIEEPKKKIIKKVIKKIDVNDQDSELAKLEEENKRIDDLKRKKEWEEKEAKRRQEEEDENNTELNMDNIDSIIAERDIEIPVVTAEEEVEEVEDVEEDEIAPEMEQDSHLRDIYAKQEEIKKMERIQKKQKEKEKWMEVMIDLPPTADPDKRIQYALKEGVPEWYLREEGYIVDDTIHEDDIYNFSSNLSNTEEEDAEELSLADLKDNLSKETNSKVDFELIKESVDMVLNDEIKEIEDEISQIEETGQIEEAIETHEVDEIIEDGVGETDMEIEDVKTVVENVVEEKLIAENEVAEEKPKSNVALNSLKERLNKLNKTRLKLSEEAEIIKSGGTGEVSDDDDNELTTVDLEVLKQKTKEVVKEAVKTVMVEKENRDEKAKTDLADRLAKLKMTREVLNKDGNTLLVKEEVVDSEGNKKSQYTSYNVSDEEVSKVSVGEVISDDVKLEKVDKAVIIDGEHYDLSKEEEAELIKKYGTREIWLLSTDSELFEKALNNLRDSRYVVKMIATERDFLLATRSVNNVIVFTMQIPNEVKKRVAGFLKYLQKEKRRARLITSEFSKVNSKVMEHVITDFTVEELDNYYDLFDYSLYSENKKELIDLYREISFDLTDSFDDIIMLDLGNKEPNVRDMKETEISLGNSIPVELEEENPLDNRSGDIEISFSDIILINDDKSLFDKNK